MSETPNTVHGRLLEAVHIAGYTARRAQDELKWLLEDGRWKTVAGGFDDIDAFLRTLDLSEFRHSIEARKELVKLLDAERASQRATARMLGVGVATVNRDLSVPNGTPTPSGPAEKAEHADDCVPSRTPAWFQSDVDPSKAAKKDVKQKKRADLRAADERRVRELTPRRGKYRTLIIDPPWDYEGLSIAGRAAPMYATMTHEELLACDVAQWAEENCHLYLWTTNNFITRACDLMRAWGFQHKTVLTWVKPRIGLGSYFRNSTEHVLFGVRGKLPTRSDSILTHFAAPLGEHSEKPDAFYEIVGKASYPPCGEIFQRKERDGFRSLFGAKA